ncbi:serine hydrolase domain-containing protein [Chitinophaga defluvii]|uniref:Serine hydrolase domain-containing protein n=1 Tax=Chitinophaga defluvii TaxID=3163343 RepID=A0ABV2TEI0_9BACT
MRTLFAHAMIAMLLAGTLCTSCKKPVDVIVNKGFDAELFAKNMTASLEGKTVGYSFAIAQDGKIVKYGVGGSARLATNSPQLDYLLTTRQATGSCSKTITALALLQALEKTSQDEDVYLADLLPGNWNIHEKNRKIKVADLLAHKSGLTYFGDDYASLRKCMATATTGFGEDIHYKYNNVNYLLCRVLIPCVVAGKGPFSVLSDIDADEAVSQIYRNYVRETIFKAAGLPDYKKIDIGPWNDGGPINEKRPALNMTMYYNFSKPALKGMMKYTTYLESGAGGWYMSAPEVAQVLLTAEAGKYVSTDMLKRMKSGFMGFDNKIDGEHGSYYWKNGYWYDNEKRGIYAVIMHFPNNVQIAWHTNSIETNIGGPLDITGKAYDNAWR